MAETLVIPKPPGGGSVPDGEFHSCRFSRGPCPSPPALLVPRPPAAPLHLKFILCPARLTVIRLKSSTRAGARGRRRGCRTHAVRSRPAGPSGCTVPAPGRRAGRKGCGRAGWSAGTRRPGRDRRGPTGQEGARAGRRFPPVSFSHLDLSVTQKSHNLIIICL